MNHHKNNPMPIWLKASMVYLCLPFLVFAPAWLKPWISIPLVILVCGALAIALFGPLPGKSWLPTSDDLKRSALIGGLALAFAFLTGLCDWVPQSTDYLKHNLIFADLAELEWPVRYSESAGAPYLCYGLGYYIIPAALAKVFGIGFADSDYPSF